MIEIVPMERLELAFVPRPWPFAERNRERIDRYFEAVQKAKPAAWNGRVLLLHDYAVVGRVFRGAYLETDYASFVAWRDWGFPDTTVRNCFALGALRGTDGGFVLGVMSAHTLNAGKVYFPAGTPDPHDLTGDMVDLAASIRREVAEETGLNPQAYEAEAGWTSVLTSTHIAQFKLLQAHEPAAALRERILTNLAAHAAPELADIRIVHGPRDLDPMMPSFVRAFLANFWSRTPR